METIDLLIAGAREKSLGEAIEAEAVGRGMVVRTIGLDAEDHIIDLLVRMDIPYRPQHVVTTVGVNKTTMGLRSHMAINVQANLDLLDWWLGSGIHDGNGPTNHFVAISSNSAHIARRESLPYCVSKAALSMAIRVRAREEAWRRYVPIYCYEPGWIEGTPMSEEVIERFGGAEALHRIPSGVGLSRFNLARMIVSNIEGGGMELNGACIRLDGGEQ